MITPVYYVMYQPEGIRRSLYVVNEEFPSYRAAVKYADSIDPKMLAEVACKMERVKKR